MERWEVRPDSDLAAILDRVQHGETVDVTREGQLVARVVPADPVDRNTTAPALEELRAFRPRFSLGSSLSVKALIAEGRR